MKEKILLFLAIQLVFTFGCASESKFVNPIPFSPIAEPPAIEGVGFGIHSDKMRAKMMAEEIARADLAAKIFTTVIKRSEVSMFNDTTLSYASKSFTILPIPCTPHEQHLLREKDRDYEWWTSLTCSLAEVEAVRPQLQETFTRLLKEAEEKSKAEIQETSQRVEDYRKIQREIFLRSGFRPWVPTNPE